MNSKQWIYPVSAVAFTMAIVIVTVPWVFPQISWQHRAAQKLERRGCKVQVIDPADLHFRGEVLIQIDGTKLKSDEAHWCGAFSQVAQLEISSSDAPEAFLAALANPEHLKMFSVNRCRVTQELLAQFNRFPNIEYLSFSGPEVTDEVFKHLGGFSNLKGLHLGDSAVTAEVLAGLAPLQRLRELTIERSSLPATGLQHLGNLDGLHLNLQGTAITSAGVAELAKLKLGSVTVSSACVNPKDILVLKAAFPGMVGEPGEPPGVTIVP